MKSIQLSLIAAFFATILTMTLAGSANGQTGYGNPNTSSQYPSVNGGQASGPGQQVEVYDKGLQMSTGTYTVPAGWQIVQDYATNPSTGQPMQQKLDIVGPQGELLRSVGMAQYAPVMGTDFEQSWRQMANAGLRGELSQITLGQITPSARMQRNRMIQQYAQTVAAQGFKLECQEASVSGQRNGQPYRGVVSIVHLRPNNMPTMGTIQVSVTISPANQLEQTLNIGEQIASSFQPNSQYQQRLMQIQQQQTPSYNHDGGYRPYRDNSYGNHDEYIKQIREGNANNSPYEPRSNNNYQQYPNGQESYYPQNTSEENSELIATPPMDY